MAISDGRTISLRLLKAFWALPLNIPSIAPTTARDGCHWYWLKSGWAVRGETSNPQAARIQLLFAFIGAWNARTHMGDPIRQPTWLEARRLTQSSSAAITSFGHRYKDQFDSDRYVLAQTLERVLIVVPDTFLSKPREAREIGQGVPHSSRHSSRRIFGSQIRIGRSDVRPAVRTRLEANALRTRSCSSMPPSLSRAKAC